MNKKTEINSECHSCKSRNLYNNSDGFRVKHGMTVDFDKGFTMIELLVVIVIIAIMASIAIFGVQGARESGRDAKRKADLANIQSALELFRSDCTDYPAEAASNRL